MLPLRTNTPHTASTLSALRTGKVIKPEVSEKKPEVKEVEKQNFLSLSSTQRELYTKSILSAQEQGRDDIVASYLQRFSGFVLPTGLAGAGPEKIALGSLSEKVCYRIKYNFSDAIECENLGGIQSFLDEYDGIVDMDFDKATPLTLAVSSKSVVVLRLLIENGADVNKEDPEGDRPLPYAMKTGRDEIVQILRDAGAGVHQEKNSLDLLSQHEHAGVSQRFFFCIRDRDLAGLRAYLNRYAGIANMDFVNSTPLISAIFCGHEDVVRLLIEHGADVNKTDPDGDYPLSSAIKQGQTGMEQMLRDADATDMLII